MIPRCCQAPERSKNSSGACGPFAASATGRPTTSRSGRLVKPTPFRRETSRCSDRPTSSTTHAAEEKVVRSSALKLAVSAAEAESSSSTAWTPPGWPRAPSLGVPGAATQRNTWGQRQYHPRKDTPMADPRLLVDRLNTPLGRIWLAVTEAGALRQLTWEETPAWVSTGRPTSDPFGCTSALRAYFEGEIAAIDGLAAEGEGTDFQRRVWRALREIPAGQTWTYGQLGRRVGNAKACRAVGAANGQNPIGLVVPCHRVIGSNGTLTGYGSGLPRKRWLLDHEARHAVGGVGRAPHSQLSWDAPAIGAKSQA